MANKQYHKGHTISSANNYQLKTRSKFRTIRIEQATIRTNFQKIYGLLKKLLAQEEVPLEYNIPPPIWVIDEANMFSQLEGSEEFAYSTCNPYIVGDLSKKEAEEYFEKHVLPRYGCKELEGKFDRVRRITGTRMMIIDKYVKEYKNCEGELECAYQILFSF
ncbi:hypothetical protein GLOIN_2v1473501 [Rhizophagus irregularis DAOM 181602=DAOM 197198]|uniref:Uncharacterized protein n=1 Tax=Rhizophagus irregularis (strain DAOM 181602 / DAOM 197198 / MUCL 43194) TaxID=747089 RepID=A0A2P4QK11_RHIID|nr:hypothetical protein GLOIN_2v1473501 [Rhizophagus irregularis DAOM 181602=DAOM 197198]POG77946.1 hypothetical protein GLOIN_2v1473501 [Rhizophagus irregularis DAOM 181602=DAOM 197198]|eukprot:XP_025184812.1 hypothetical protein GLOIN_2v1473501 [Rhizophagus irregularis DAOM 181602=DAOM 197198]